MRKAGEVHHHTPGDVAGYIAQALQVVNETDVPPELRGIAFSQAITLLAAKQIFFEQPSPVMAIPRGLG